MAETKFAPLVAAATSRNLAAVSRAAEAITTDNALSAELVRSHLEVGVRAEALRLAHSKAPVDEINEFLEFVVQLAHENLCAKSLTVVLLQDVFEASATQRCEELFAIVETRIDTWKTDFFFDACKNSVLRMCNDLLKRLSRTVQTAFCGRVLILLAKSLPLNERSGLNLMSQTNVQNVTAFELKDKAIKDEPKEEDGEEKPDVEIGEIGEEEKEIRFDYELYAKFWQLQEFFANPPLAYKRDRWKTFEENLNDVLLVLAAHKLEAPREDRMSVKQEGVKREAEDVKMEVDGQPDDAATNPEEFEGFAAKYLTNQKIFHLQLADSTFRRYFLVQSLVLLQYFLTPEVKSRDASAQLTSKQEEAVRGLNERCLQLLRETHPYGRHFADTKLIANDRLWSNWKNGGCPDLVAQTKAEELVEFKRKPLRAFNPAVVDLGNAELTRLWRTTLPNGEATRAANRDFLPATRPFLDGPLDEFDPEQQVDEEYQSVNDERFQWQCSRLLFHLNTQRPPVTPAVHAAGDKTAMIPAARQLRNGVLEMSRTIPELKEKAEKIRERLDVAQRAADQRRAEAEAKAAEAEAERRRLEKQQRSEDLQRKLKEENARLEEREKREKEERAALASSKPPAAASKSDGKSGEKSGEKSEQKPREKSMDKAERVIDSIVEKSKEKPSEKPADRVEKPAERADKSAERADKPKDKSGEKPREKTAEKPTERAEKPRAKSVDRSSDRSRSTDKPADRTSERTARAEKPVERPSRAEKADRNERSERTDRSADKSSASSSQKSTDRERDRISAPAKDAAPPPKKADRTITMSTSTRAGRERTPPPLGPPRAERAAAKRARSPSAAASTSTSRERPEASSATKRPPIAPAEFLGRRVVVVKEAKRERERNEKSPEPKRTRTSQRSSTHEERPDERKRERERRPVVERPKRSR